LEKGNRSVNLVIALSVSLILILNAPTNLSSFIQLVLAQPSVRDPNLDVQEVVGGLSSPTSMIFLNKSNILVSEKEGNVRLVTNGVLQEQPILQVSAKAESERGLLGVASSSDNNSPHNTNIFLYYTGGDPVRNRVYKYQWNGETLVNPTLILDLPAAPGYIHVGGKIVIGPDGYLYAVIGDLNHYGKLQNFPDWPPPDDTGSIFRINPEDGSAAPDNPFATSEGDILSKYYAYGIRNSFGLDFDPLTGKLWDTENGPSSFDEVNLVRPGFNSGWYTVMGPISLSGVTEDDLVNFPGSHYADPLFSWADSVGPTDIEFFNSSSLGSKYENNIFVGDIKWGNLYFLEVNEKRDGIIFDTTQQLSGLTDLVVNNNEELSSIIFGSGFGGITDIETGPDELLYVLSYANEIEKLPGGFLNISSYNNGAIYKISSNINTR
jgi:glucose/arabinose dehydrogenase